MLTSPVVVLLAWGGVAALRRCPGAAISRWPARRCSRSRSPAACSPPTRCSTTAPISRPPRAIRSCASLDSRFAGSGPALFTDFDEYSMYELRDLDVGGPDFVYPPPALAGGARGYGDPVELDRVPPVALLAYPLIVTRRDPAASRPPSAYRAAMAGRLLRGVGTASQRASGRSHIALAGSRARMQCTRIAAWRAPGSDARLIAAERPS